MLSRSPRSICWLPYPEISKCPDGKPARSQTESIELLLEGLPAPALPLVRSPPVVVDEGLVDGGAHDDHHDVGGPFGLTAGFELEAAQMLQHVGPGAASELLVVCPGAGGLGVAGGRADELIQRRGACEGSRDVIHEDLQRRGQVRCCGELGVPGLL